MDSIMNDVDISATCWHASPTPYSALAMRRNHTQRYQPLLSAIHCMLETTTNGEVRSLFEPCGLGSDMSRSNEEHWFNSAADLTLDQCHRLISAVLNCDVLTNGSAGLTSEISKVLLYLFQQSPDSPVETHAVPIVSICCEATFDYLWNTCTATVLLWTDSRLLQALLLQGLRAQPCPEQCVRFLLHRLRISSELDRYHVYQSNPAAKRQLEFLSSLLIMSPITVWGPQSTLVTEWTQSIMQWIHSLLGLITEPPRTIEQHQPHLTYELVQIFILTVLEHRDLALWGESNSESINILTHQFLSFIFSLLTHPHLEPLRVLPLCITQALYTYLTEDLKTMLVIESLDWTEFFPWWRSHYSVSSLSRLGARAPLPLFQKRLSLRFCFLSGYSDHETSVDIPATNAVIHPWCLAAGLHVPVVCISGTTAASVIPTIISALPSSIVYPSLDWTVVQPILTARRLQNAVLRQRRRLLLQLTRRHPGSETASTTLLTSRPHRCKRRRKVALIAETLQQTCSQSYDTASCSTSGASCSTSGSTETVLPIQTKLTQSMSPLPATRARTLQLSLLLDIPSDLILEVVRFCAPLDVCRNILPLSSFLYTLIQANSSHSTHNWHRMLLWQAHQLKMTSIIQRRVFHCGYCDCRHAFVTLAALLSHLYSIHHFKPLDLCGHSSEQTAVTSTGVSLLPTAKSRFVHLSWRKGPVRIYHFVLPSLSPLTLPVDSSTIIGDGSSIPASPISHRRHFRRDYPCSVPQCSHVDYTHQEARTHLASHRDYKSMLCQWHTLAPPRQHFSDCATASIAASTERDFACRFRTTTIKLLRSHYERRHHVVFSTAEHAVLDSLIQSHACSIQRIPHPTPGTTPIRIPRSTTSLLTLPMDQSNVNISVSEIDPAKKPEKFGAIDSTHSSISTVFRLRRLGFRSAAVMLEDSSVEETEYLVPENTSSHPKSLLKITGGVVESDRSESEDDNNVKIVTVATVSPAIVPLACPWARCAHVAESIALIFQHYTQHSSKPPLMCSFDGCGRLFCYRSVLTWHETSHQPDKRNNICSVCKFAFFYAGELSSHMRREHHGESTT